jgi:hypothetical protein
MLVLIIAYTASMFLIPTLSPWASLMAHFAHALAWGAFHSFGLGLLLRAQSNDKFMVRHFMKHYHYSQGEGSRGAVLEAFQNWKGLYNLSLTMSYGISAVSFCYSILLCCSYIFISLIHWLDMEDIHAARRLDARR